MDFALIFRDQEVEGSNPFAPTTSSCLPSYATALLGESLRQFSTAGSTASLVLYNSSNELKERHNLPQEMLLNIAAIGILLASAGE